MNKLFLVSITLAWNAANPVKADDFCIEMWTLLGNPISEEMEKATTFEEFKEAARNMPDYEDCNKEIERLDTLFRKRQLEKILKGGSVFTYKRSK
jgi:hypothetical protein